MNLRSDSLQNTRMQEIQLEAPGVELQAWNSLQFDSFIYF